MRVRSVSSEHAAQYLQYRARRVRPHRGDAAALRYLIEFLRSGGVIPAEKVPTPRPTPVERCTQAFEHYLREARAGNATIINYVPFIRGFLKDCFGDGTVRLSRLCAGDVVRFVRRQAPRLHPKRAKL